MKLVHQIAILLIIVASSSGTQAQNNQKGNGLVAERLFKRLDINQDNRLSYAEFSANPINQNLYEKQPRNLRLDDEDYSNDDQNGKKSQKRKEKHDEYKVNKGKHEQENKAGQDDREDDYKRPKKKREYKGKGNGKRPNSANRPGRDDREDQQRRKKPRTADRSIEAFHKMDKNEDGYLSYSEFKNGVKQSFNDNVQNGSLKFSSRLFDELDRNNDGKVNYGEFRNSNLRNIRDLSNKEKRKIFNDWDRNNDSFLQENEIRFK